MINFLNSAIFASDESSIWNIVIFLGIIICILLFKENKEDNKNNNNQNDFYYDED